MKSKSAIEAYFHCPRAYKFRYVDRRIRHDEDATLTFGKAWHDVMEAHHTGVEPKPKTLVQRAMLEQYKNVYPDPVIFHEAEKEFQIPELGLKGVFDGLVVNADTVTIWEHKTTKTDLVWGQWYFDKLEYDWQVGLYQLAARHLYPGKDVSVVYNVARVPQLKARKFESAANYAARCSESIAADPEKYFKRAAFRWSETKLDLLKQEHRVSLVAMEQDTLYPQSRACFHFMRKCDYYGVCHSGEDITDEKLYKIREK